jgi:amino acid permease
MSTTSFLFRQQPSNLARFGLWVGYFFSINSVIGAGFLALPYSFNQSGWLLSLLIMILVAIQTYYMALELLEMTSKAECIKQLEEAGIEVPRPSFLQVLKGGFNKVQIPDEIKPEIVDRRFDVTSLSEIVLGHKVGILYMVGLYLFLTGALVSYVSIFASSFAATVPLGFSDVCNIYEDEEFFGACRINYWFYLAIYSASMMYLTIKGLREQRWMQAVLTLMRFVIIFLILVTCIALLVAGKDINSDDHVSFKMPPLFRIDKLVSALPSITFAFIYQLQFPSIIEFMKDKERTLKKIVILVSLTSFTVYSLLSVIVPTAIHDVNPQCSIDYSKYSAGYSQSKRPAWTYIIAYIVVLFPAFDVFSSFPVVAVTIADNLQSVKEGISNEDFMQAGNKRFYRIFAVTVPVIISFLTFNLHQIIDWVGIVGYLLVQILFPVMHVYYREIIDAKSPYDTPFYSKVSFI